MSKNIEEVVIIKALRTPIGRLRGALAPVRADDLLATVFSGLFTQRDLRPHEIDEVIAGCANQAGEDNRNVARMAWLLSGGPVDVPAFTVNRLCASGLDAVVQAYRGIAIGAYDVAVAGGVESMTRAPLVMQKPERAFANGNHTIFDTSLGWRFPNTRMAARFPLEGMGETAENIAERYAITRDAQDAYALASHRKALDAWEAGRFASEVLPVEIPERKGGVRCFDRDEGPRADTSMDKLRSLKAAFRSGGSVTAGNSSTLNDGAAALVLMRRSMAEERGLPILGQVLGAASAGVDPQVMGLGPIAATKKLCARLGMRPQDFHLVELNEAFAVQALAVMRDLDLLVEKVNVNGGAIALGHPLGCSGARILTTLLHEMGRRDVELGLATLCVGVGQGVSLAVRRV